MPKPSQQQQQALREARRHRAQVEARRQARQAEENLKAGFYGRPAQVFSCFAEFDGEAGTGRGGSELVGHKIGFVNYSDFGNGED